METIKVDKKDIATIVTQGGATIRDREAQEQK